MAINFPSTAGQATDGSYTYNVAGIVYAWNGSSWEAAGAGASATDRTLFSVTTNAAGSAALSYNNTNGVFSYTPPDLSSYLTAEADTLATVTARGSQTNTGVYFPDGIKATFGAASPNTELEIYRDVGGINSYISDVGTGDLRITTNSSIEFMKGTSATLAKFTSDGACELRYNNTTRIETTNTGATITGALTAGGLTFPTSNGTSGQVLTCVGCQRSLPNCWRWLATLAPTNAILLLLPNLKIVSVRARSNSSSVRMPSAALIAEEDAVPTSHLLVRDVIRPPVKRRG